MKGPSVSGRRQIKLWGTVSLVAAALVGVAVWLMWPSSEPVVSLPARVCDEALPTGAPAALLPRTGKDYYESVVGSVEFNAPHDPAEPSPACNFSGGGRHITVEHDRHFNDKSLAIRAADEAKEAVAEEAQLPGRAPLSLGRSYGYAWKHGAVLLLNCRDEGEEGVIKVNVYDWKKFASEDSDAKAFGELAADTLRMATKSVYRCDHRSALPGGPPRLGRPREG
ncbi:hypothetical protein GCM10018785_47140 [Streptomyces longispororuber]|uniref:DUF3558 domain-containing protein n=1 Tax=Streptomyces longispororuber TaxID=68230 RepID=A0A918ZVZ0_9ACTN|nr:hypothetical protein [Streptomyces longispororuber]GHE73594.1 hypothetical protein GCM10018785_47140 [Streptomyces longispororuber]